MLQEMLFREDQDLRTWDEAAAEVADFFNDYIREKHPCKDAAGEPLWNFKAPLYDLQIDNVSMPELAKPQTVNLLEVLEETFYDAGKERTEPDTTQFVICWWPWLRMH